MLPCPRRAETCQQLSDPSEDKFDPCCNYCGSMEPDKFMDMLEKGHIVLGSTDKNYKVYVHNRSEVPGDAAYRLGNREIKFYFQHLSQEQRAKFVDLWNSDLEKNELFKFRGDFSFSVMPFFMQRKS